MISVSANAQNGLDYSGTVAKIVFFLEIQTNETVPRVFLFLTDDIDGGAFAHTYGTPDEQDSLSNPLLSGRILKWPSYEVKIDGEQRSTPFEIGIADGSGTLENALMDARVDDVFRGSQGTFGMYCVYPGEKVVLDQGYIQPDDWDAETMTLTLTNNMSRLKTKIPFESLGQDLWERIYDKDDSPQAADVILNTSVGDGFVGRSRKGIKAAKLFDYWHGIGRSGIPILQPDDATPEGS